MKATLTITSKGQTTIPVALRRKLGLAKDGGVLQVDFNERKGEMVITKSTSLDTLSRKLSQYIKPGTEPVIDADVYYQAHREADA
jgi:bifunctional DNA-binding transcriptional regulator/antitoxin component of YhaV-PrlF toxin-antitoxin module